METETDLGMVTYYSEDISDLYRFAAKLGVPVMAFPEEHGGGDYFKPPMWLVKMNPEIFNESWMLNTERGTYESLHHENANSIRLDRNNGQIYFEKLSDISWAETDEGGEFNSPNIRVHCPNEMRKYLLQG